MTELLVLQIILGMFTWINLLIAITCLLQIEIESPCPFTKWYEKYPAYLIAIIILFFIWPLGAIRLIK